MLCHATFALACGRDGGGSALGKVLVSGAVVGFFFVFFFFCLGNFEILSDARKVACRKDGESPGQREIMLKKKKKRRRGKERGSGDREEAARRSAGERERKKEKKRKNEKA